MLSKSDSGKYMNSKSLLLHYKKIIHITIFALLKPSKWGWVKKMKKPEDCPHLRGEE